MGRPTHVETPPLEPYDYFCIEDALQRASIYEDHGADAILCHSKKETAEDIEAFMSNWKGKVPVIIVPTTYINTPISKFDELGVSGVIWANHQLRKVLSKRSFDYKNKINSMKMKKNTNKYTTI